MDLLNNVEATVNVAGVLVHFVKLKLEQEFNDHHRCEVLINSEELESSWMSDPIRIIKNIGESITITFTHKITGNTNTFAGIISNISFVGNNEYKNNILIQGISETVKLDGKATLDSFVDKPLSSIVSESVSNSGNGASVIISPKYSRP